jgi:hypothetical protein
MGYALLYEKIFAETCNGFFLAGESQIIMDGNGGPKLLGRITDLLV